ncbi:hypothetical protein [Methanoplanus endosymbiosus]|uniref:ATP-binding protein n=1 Tax=Methanoplanus endosymbiosus TaxID=33865 RepID=A0A9E7PK06_9EURY|nr:hypothetical protein [Methanoplanus endosymbiosus]UUX91403.1 hypothetical protein L6E24_08415 [Methanoplanus endosymbiosus]
MTDIVYDNFFEIDPNYFPMMTEELIKSEDGKWKGFYPHEKFVELIKHTVNTLNRHEKQSLWVTGAYGTGKSHAVLTIKCMLEAKREDVTEYFEKNDLDMDLCSRLNNLKGQGHILTVYRNGSASIDSTAALTLAIQSSIKKALEEQGIENKSNITLKETIVNRLTTKKIYSDYIDKLMQEKYNYLFSPYSNVTSFLEAIQNSDDEISNQLINKYLNMLNMEGISGHPIEPNDLVRWIDEVLKANNLTSIFFIWDEFTEFFKINQNKLTGLQEIAESTQHMPFVLMLVTHISGKQLPLGDSKKISDRFAPPIEICLPDNTAFKLMGKALAVKDNQEVCSQWQTLRSELWSNVCNSGKLVIRSTNNKVTENDFKEILPIHPYAALILKHLSARFNSNQRSMFEFIKGGDVKSESISFKSFIHQTGPFSPIPYLTCDKLWDYFYSSDKARLDTELKDLLNTYNIHKDNKAFDSDTLLILKTTLLLQGLSNQAWNVPILKPTLNNLTYAFEGTDLAKVRIEQILEILIGNGVLSSHPGKNSEIEYVALRANSDTAVISQLVQEMSKKYTTLELIQKNNDLDKLFELPEELSLRYESSYLTITNIDAALKRKVNNPPNKIRLFFTFAKDDQEASIINEKIQNFLSACLDSGIIIVDTSLSSLKSKNYDDIIECLANVRYWKDKNISKQVTAYDSRVTDIINQWNKELINGVFVLYDSSHNGQKFYSFDLLTRQLRQINEERFPKGIERLSNSKTLRTIQQSKRGAIMAASGGEKPSGMFNSLVQPLSEIWTDNYYWGHAPDHLLSQIKNELKIFMDKRFTKDGKVDIYDIWDFLTRPPYGFLPCSLSAFVLGFLLREYANDQYTWSNGSIAEPMSAEKLGELIDGAIKSIPGNRPSSRYIVQMTEEEKEFMNSSAFVFNVPSVQCTSIENTRNKIINAINGLRYPLWALKNYIDSQNTTQKDLLKNIIDDYCSISSSSPDAKKVVKAKVNSIGKTFQQHAGLSNAVRDLITPQNTREGMDLYVRATYPDLITIAQSLNDNNYLEAIKNRFSADSAWLWCSDDIDNAIMEVVSDYRIFDSSNHFIGTKTSIQDVIREWNNKLNEIRIPFDIILSSEEQLTKPLTMLFNMCKTRSLSSSDKRELSDVLQSYKIELDEFFCSDTQIRIFNENFSDKFANLSIDKIKDLYLSLPRGQIYQSKSEYDQRVVAKIEDLRCVQLYQHLESEWYRISGEVDPKVWSNKYELPILYLFDDEPGKARDLCSILLNKGSSDESKIEGATAFLKNCSDFAKIKDMEYIQMVFQKKILGDYEYVIEPEDISALILELKSKVDEDIYSWVDKRTLVDKVVEDYAKKSYLKSGFTKAFSKIDNMSPDEAKKYLKDLIKNDLRVGIAIIRRLE